MAYWVITNVSLVFTTLNLRCLDPPPHNVYTDPVVKAKDAFCERHTSVSHLHILQWTSINLDRKSLLKDRHCFVRLDIRIFHQKMTQQEFRRFVTNTQRDREINNPVCSQAPQGDSVSRTGMSGLGT